MSGEEREPRLWSWIYVGLCLSVGAQGRCYGRVKTINGFTCGQDPGPGGLSGGKPYPDRIVRIWMIIL